MRFRICVKEERVLYQQDLVCLRSDSKDGFRFWAVYYDAMGREFELGHVTIGRRGLASGKIRDELHKEFVCLEEPHFSIGHSDLYYDRIAHLGDVPRREILRGLRDVAFDLDIFDQVRDEAVLQRLLKGIKESEIRGQFHRIAFEGGARLTEYSFKYTARESADSVYPPLCVEFEVTPNSYPPTNVHALIGRNGCGKTHLIRNMVQCLQNREGPYGRFEYSDKNKHAAEFANVLCIAFSPFDDFAKLIQKNGDIPATFVGLDKKKGDLLNSIRRQFWRYFELCLMSERKRLLWKKTISILSSDLTFKEEGVLTFMDEAGSNSGRGVKKQIKDRILKTFDGLSSGHKVVLLIVTSCVAEVEERSVVFLDEPENHLHPPLLSALIRSLSELLKDRNGVTIISTHSPVVLQEVPMSCVWLLTRNGPKYVKAERLVRETFGTSQEKLIDDVFHFEVNKSGFHQLMEEASEQYDSYDEVMDLYRGQLGNEAGMHLWLLMQKKHKGGA